MPLPPGDPPSRAITYSCGGCDTRWAGVSRCHCAGCHETFSGLELFDRHRRDVRGTPTCLDPAVWAAVNAP